MTYDRTHNDRARLEMNARLHREDPHLELACRLWDEDRAAFDKLPRSVKAQHDIYRDMRQHFRDAVEAGVIAPDGTVIHPSTF